jgi:plastocyanin
MLAIGLLGLVAAAGPSTPNGTPAPARDTTVAIRTFQFRPAPLVIPMGTRVIWLNGDDIEHTVTAGIPDTATGGFHGIMKTQDATFAFTFGRAGTFSYYCDRHHFMRGEIRVTATGEN